MKKTLKAIGYETLKLLVFAILISLAIPNTHAAQVGLTKGLVMYYNGTATFNDSIGNHDLTNFGTINTLGKLDRARKFDGTNDYMTAADHSDFEDVNKISISFWANVTAGTDNDRLFADDGFEIRQELDGSHGSCTAGNHFAFVIVGKNTVCLQNATFTTGTWEYWTFVKNGTGVYYYKNGLKIEFDPETNTMNTGTSPLYIGWSTSTFFYEGSLDEIGIYNKSLSASNITRLYNSGTGCNPVSNPNGCSAPAATQTPTPTNFKNITVTTTSIIFNWTGNMGSKYLLYQNGTNVENFTTKPFTRSGLTPSTKYGFKIKAYNVSYTTILSNFSNQVNVTTLFSPTLTLKTNIIQYENYTMNPFIFRFNGTTTSTNVSFYCKLWAPYSTKGVVDKWITNITKNQNLSFSTADYQSGSDYSGFVPLNLTCQNNQISLGSAVISRAVWIDSDAASITYTGSNNSKYYRRINTALPFIFTYSDDNLYLINTTLCASASGTTCTQQISNWVDTGLTDDTRLVNVTNTLASLPPAYQRYYIFAQAWDGHTAAAIDDYDLSYLSDGVKTGVKIDNAIEITSPDAEVIELTKNVDRYNFDVVLKQPTDNIIFNLKSNGNLTYNPHSEYLGHFIDFENRKWIDFENPNAESFSYVKVSDKEYQVIVHMKPQKKGMELDQITFNSIGDLNYVSKYVYFNISNSSLIRAKDRITNLNIQNITVKVYTYPNTLIQQKSTTNYNISLNITSGTYYINVSGNAGGVNYITNRTPNVTFSQNLNRLVYLSLANSLYLLIYDEQTDELIDDRNVTIQVINYQNISRVYTTATGSTFQSDFATGFYEINYQANNYTARSYYTTISGGDTQTLRLYLLLDTDSTHQYLNYDIVDESAAPISNSTLKMQRYYIGNGTVGEWRTVEMSIANDQGKGFVFAELFDATYRFIVEYPFGTTKKITSQTKLDTRDLFFSITLIDIGLTNYYQSGDVATTLTFSNTTKIWTYSFNGASLEEVEEGRFLVQKYTPQAVTTICNTTVSASSGGMTCNLTAYSDDDSTFVAKGFVTFASDSLEYLVEGASLKITANYLKYGMNGVFWGMVAVGTMALIGIFSPVGSIILALFGLALTNVMGLMYFNYAWLVGVIIVGLIYIFNLRRY